MPSHRTDLQDFFSASRNIQLLGRIIYVGKQSSGTCVSTSLFILQHYTAILKACLEDIVQAGPRQRWGTGVKTDATVEYRMLFAHHNHRIYLSIQIWGCGEVWNNIPFSYFSISNNRNIEQWCITDRNESRRTAWQWEISRWSNSKLIDDKENVQWYGLRRFSSLLEIKDLREMPRD